MLDVKSTLAIAPLVMDMQIEEDLSKLYILLLNSVLVW